MRAKRIAVIGAAIALIAAVGAVVALAAGGTGSWHAGWGMAGGRYVYRPSQPTQIKTLAQARAQAQKFADRLGLRVDEVMQFTRNFYAKLLDGQGSGATEVLVDPSSGVVSIEYGPAMMWNTRYGMGRASGSMMGSYGRGMMRGGGMMGSSARMMGTGTTTTGGYGPGMMRGYGGGSGMMQGYGRSGSSSSATTVSLVQAHTLAQRWLDQHESGVKVESAGDTFPGYYTLETLKDGKVVGMISVNAVTGAVWPHWWHGTFIATSG